VLARASIFGGPCVLKIVAILEQAVLSSNGG